MSKELREALAELVALQDLKDRIDNADRDMFPLGLSKFRQCEDEYARRKPLAWAAARVALSQPPAGQEPCNSAGETPTQHAHRWATELATSMARKFYPECPQWKPLPDLLGVITQIDNMATGLTRAAPAGQGAEPVASIRWGHEGKHEVMWHSSKIPSGWVTCYAAPPAEQAAPRQEKP